MDKQNDSLRRHLLLQTSLRRGNIARIATGFTTDFTTDLVFLTLLLTVLLPMYGNIARITTDCILTLCC